MQSYPPYSSQFWEQARSGELDESTLPKKEVTIYTITPLDKKTISGKDVLEKIQGEIGMIQGDFRQTEILSLWEKGIDREAQYPVISIRISCSSGTYMRSLAQELGKELGTPALAFHIKRTKIGNFTIQDTV